MEDGPLVCERSNFDALESFYVAGEGNEVFLEKIAEIKRRSINVCRPHGLRSDFE